MHVSRNVFLVALAALAGWVDALSFSQLGQVFTSFQSGNLIFLGLAIDDGDGQQLVGAAVSLAAFVAGTAIGAYDVRRLMPAFVVQWALLVAFAVYWQVHGTPASDSGARLVLVALAALAMGNQGAAVLALRIPGVVTNAMTATVMLGGVLIGLGAHGERAAGDASPLSASFVLAVCGSYTVSALAVGAIGRPDLTCAVPATVLTLLLVRLAVGSPLGDAALRRAGG